MTELLRTLKELDQKVRHNGTLVVNHLSIAESALLATVKDNLPQILSALERAEESEAREKKLREYIMSRIRHAFDCRSVQMGDLCDCTYHDFRRATEEQIEEVLKEGERS